MSEDIEFSDVMFDRASDTDSGSNRRGDRLYIPDRHPTHEHIHAIEWPRELTPPFRLDVKEYSVPDEPIVRSLNTIQAVITTSREIDAALVHLCDNGATQLRRMQQGDDDPHIKTTRYEWLVIEQAMEPTHFDRLNGLRRHISQWRDDAMPRFDEPMTELCSWVTGIYIATDRCIEAIEDGLGFYYDDSYMGEFDWVADPVPTDEHIERLESTYDEFKQKVYDVDLEFVVNDLYDKLETPKETNEQLGFDDNRRS